jgi:hypothetical protein
MSNASEQLAAQYAAAAAATRDVSILEVQQARVGYTDLKTRLDTDKNRVDNIVSNAGSSNTEIVDARNKADGTSSPTLKKRLDDSDVVLGQRAPIKSSGFPWPTDLVAFWDFSESAPPYAAKAGADRFPLVAGTSTPTADPAAPFGGGISLNGTTDYLTIPAANTGALHAGKTGDQVTIIAWVKRSASNSADSSQTIAGMWQEDNTAPKRQYALFASLPLYGGRGQVCGHVSKTGGASPNIPYSRDYSANARIITKDGTRCIGFTYDGAQSMAYMDGISDVRASYTEPGAPNGEGLTYAKNPYLFDLGLNRASLSDFTVGAVKLTAGMANYFPGSIYGLAVFRRALSPAEMLRVHMDALAPTDPFLYLDCSSLDAGAHPPLDYGWKSVRGASGAVTSDTTYSWLHTRFDGNNAYLSRSNTAPSGNTNNSATNALMVFDAIHDMKFSQLGKISFTLNNSLAGDTVRVCVCVGGQWYATATEYDHPGGGVGSDWTTGITTSVTITRDKTQWLALTYTYGSALSLGAQPATNLPNGALTGIGFFSKSMQVNGLIRLKDVKLFA